MTIFRGLTAFPTVGAADGDSSHPGLFLHQQYRGISATITASSSRRNYSGNPPRGAIRRVRSVWLCSAIRATKLFACNPARGAFPKQPERCQRMLVRVVLRDKPKVIRRAIERKFRYFPLSLS